MLSSICIYYITEGVLISGDQYMCVTVFIIPEGGTACGNLRMYHLAVQ